jgi:hypothetical protein
MRPSRRPWEESSSWCGRSEPSGCGFQELIHGGHDAGDGGARGGVNVGSTCYGGRP